MTGSEAGMDGGATGGVGAGIIGAGFGAAGFGAAGFAAAFGAGFGAAFFFGAAFLALAFAFDFPFAFIGRVFFFAALFLAGARLAFAIGFLALRFFDLLFFAMVTLLLEIDRTLTVRVALKKSAVISSVMRWSVSPGLRRLPKVSDPDTIHPLKDVWLKPRRVFRELAASPIGFTDYLLAAAQGIATSIALYRSQLAGTHVGAQEILFSSIMFGALGGILSTYLFSAIYSRLGRRAGGTSAFKPVFHILAYGSLPLAASLLLWGFTALFIGEAAINDMPGSAEDGFVAFVQRAQFIAWAFLVLWSVVLQVMGLSEILGLDNRKALGVYVLGQVVALLAALFLSFLLALLLPGMLPAVPH
jgi:hypothetical protein